MIVKEIALLESGIISIYSNCKENPPSITISTGYTEHNIVNTTIEEILQIFSRSAKVRLVAFQCKNLSAYLYLEKDTFTVEYLPYHKSENLFTIKFGIDQSKERHVLIQDTIFDVYNSLLQDQTIGHNSLAIYKEG